VQKPRGEGECFNKKEEEERDEGLRLRVEGEER
jgi:hypothetical protein